MKNIDWLATESCWVTDHVAMILPHGSETSRQTNYHLLR